MQQIIYKNKKKIKSRIVLEKLIFKNCFDKNFFYVLKKINLKISKIEEVNLLNLNMVNKSNFSIYSAYAWS